MGVGPVAPPVIAAATARVLTRKAKAAEKSGASRIRFDYLTAPGPRRSEPSFLTEDFFTSSATGLGQLPAAAAAPAAGGIWSNLSSVVSSILPTAAAMLQNKLLPKPKEPKAPKAPKPAPAPAAPAPAPARLPGWAIPAAIGGVALVGVVLFVTLRKR